VRLRTALVAAVRTVACRRDDLGSGIEADLGPGWVYRHRQEIPHVVLPGGGYGLSGPRLARWIRKKEL
jgi:hypothetical protein